MSAEKKPIVFCGILTVSDRCAAGVTEDISGPNIQKIFDEYTGLRTVVKVRKIVQDDRKAIEDTLKNWADKENVDVIVTVGGTGFGPRDVTPEATSAVIEREANGITTGLIAASLAVTRFALLSRMKSGIRGKSLIMNFPGSKKASEECLRFVLPILNHAVDLLKNNVESVASQHSDPNIVIAPQPASTARVNGGGSSTGTSRSPIVEKIAPQHHVVVPDHHVVVPDDHVVVPDHHVVVPDHHVVVPDHHVVVPDHHIVVPDHHVVAPDHHVVAPDHHVVAPDHHVVSAAHHVLDPLQNIAGGSALLLNELDLENIDKESDISMATLESILPPRTKRKSTVAVIISNKVARRDRTSAYPLIPMERATEIVLENATVLPVKTAFYKDALRETIAADIVAPEPIPQFAASVKDGYAVIAADTPGELRVAGTSITGYPTNERTLQRGQAVRITTGAPIPPGANAVVQVEDTKLVEEADQGETEIRIQIMSKATVGQDIRGVGSDIKKNEVVLPKGAIVAPTDIGILASLGITNIPVYSKPTVAVLSTGNELTEPENGPLEKGQIRDSNRQILLSALKYSRYDTIDVGIVPDEPEKLRLSLEGAIAKADVIISTGGVSMGEKDYLKPVLQGLGGKIEFGRVLLKPGKPTTFATFNNEGRNKLFFALPGNPVSAAVTYQLFVLPALKKMSGYENPIPPVIKARISSDIDLDSRPEYQRSTVTWKPNDNCPWAISTGNQKSSRLLSMRNATALLALPPKTPKCEKLLRGDLVDVCILKTVI